MTGSGVTGRRRTTTSAFGVGRREGHDASGFYARFAPPVITADERIGAVPPLENDCVLGDARRMAELPDNSVALVVTSPPYFVGKQYEEELARDGVPTSYLEYLDLLRDVFRESARVLEPGGRLAVNVANLGRKPYRSLSADVIRILQDDLGLLLRGEVIWKKADGASGSCAWGSFRRPANPVLRDITERVVIASKGRFDRALSASRRAALNLPHEATLTSDEFMENTLDVWEIPAESAQRVGHPAPFPVELPERLIRLYTYKGDVVLDPFLGSGSTVVAAVKCERRGIGYDLDPDYVDIARKRVAAARPAKVEVKGGRRARKAIAPPAPVDADVNFQARATKEGKAAKALAEQVLVDAGFKVVGRDVKQRGLGLVVNFEALDRRGAKWFFDVTGAFTTARGGLARTDTVFKCLGRANVMRSKGRGPLVLLTSHLPKKGSEGDVALRAAGPEAFFDAVEMLSDDGRDRLEKYAVGGHHLAPAPGFWTDADLAR